MTMCEPSAWPTPRSEKTTAEKLETWQKRKDAGGVATPPLGLLMSGFSQQAFLASPPAEPDHSAEAKITAGSGRRLCACFDTTSPLGRFSRTLLESETWASPEFSLKWQARVTKCGSTVFQLAPSARRTAGSGTGSWPTPAKRDEKGQTQNPERMDYVPNILLATWPTPAKSDGSGGPQHPDKRKAGGHSQQLTDYAIGPASSGCLARTEKFAVRLMTLSAWLMGYSTHYLALWDRSTARSSGRSETASSRKSRKS